MLETQSTESSPGFLQFLQNKVEMSHSSLGQVSWPSSHHKKLVKKGKYSLE